MNIREIFTKVLSFLSRFHLGRDKDGSLRIEYKHVSFSHKRKRCGSRCENTDDGVTRAQSGGTDEESQKGDPKHEGSQNS